MIHYCRGVCPICVREIRYYSFVWGVIFGALLVAAARTIGVIP